MVRKGKITDKDTQRSTDVLVSYTPCAMPLLAAELFRKLSPQTHIKVFGDDLIRGAGIKNRLRNRPLNTIVYSVNL